MMSRTQASHTTHTEIVITETEYYRNMPRDIDRTKLAERTVVIVGLGSGGSVLLTVLARLGFRFKLLDRPGERLETSNLFRHACSVDQLGETKLSAAAELVRRVNPFAHVDTYACDVCEEPELLEQHLSNAAVLVGATDNEPSKHALNNAAVRCGVPLCLAGVYPGDVGLEVFWRYDDHHPCYACATRLLARPADLPPSRDYTNPLYSELTSTPALHITISLAAMLQADVALKLCHRPYGIPSPMPGNLYVFMMRPHSGVSETPFSGRWVTVPKADDCLICGAGPNKRELTAEGQKLLCSVTPAEDNDI